VSRGPPLPRDVTKKPLIDLFLCSTRYKKFIEDIKVSTMYMLDKKRISSSFTWKVDTEEIDE